MAYGKVVGYNEETLMRFGSFCQCEGSMLANPVVALHIVILWALAALSYCVCWGVLGETGLRATDIKSVTSFVDVFNGLVAFVLSLYVSLTLTRWWSTLYTHYGGLWGASDDLAKRQPRLQRFGRQLRLIVRLERRLRMRALLPRVG